MHANQRDNQSDPNEGTRLAPKNLYDALLKNNIKLFCGVPDSLLQNFCAYVTDNATHHIITANEGNAIALAIGHYVATNELPLVYMQNSGLGNCINPLLSLADKEIYGIPMLLLIGWRGQPNIKDEPQHLKQGRVMLAMLEAMEIPYSILPTNNEQIEKEISQACDFARNNNSPYALIVKKDSFTNYSLKNTTTNQYELSREQAIITIASSIKENDVIVSTTGFSSRELFEYRQNSNLATNKDFLTVGGMGHASQIALGIALATKNHSIYCIDGDGSALMHLGSMAINSQSDAKNFKHILINNGVHHSVGGQETVGMKIDFTQIAKGCGYKLTIRVTTMQELEVALQQIQETEEPAFLEVRVNLNVRANLARPTSTPTQNKQALMEFLR